MINSTALHGLKILVTRPVHQAKNLCEGITALGGIPLLFPTVEIVAIEDKTDLIAAMARLGTQDLVIFISANAVTNVMPYWPPPACALNNLAIAAIGFATAHCLAQHKIHTDILPVGACSSEGLLNHPELLHCKAKKVTLFSGAGGRTLLADTLKKRGAEVTQVAVYRRVLPQHTDVMQNQGLLDGLDIVVSTSVESLQNLLYLTGPAAKRQLLNLPLLVISPRMAAFAHEFGFTRPPILTNGPSDAAILEALKAWYSNGFG